MKYTNMRIVVVRDAMGRPLAETSFDGQMIDYKAAVNGTVLSADGHLSSFRSDNAQVLWHLADVATFAGATEIKIYTASGQLLVEGPLSGNWPPKKVQNGVEIQID